MVSYTFDKLGITLPSTLIETTDKIRGDIPRSTFIRRVIEQYIEGRKEIGQ